jgi:hypothetical protein
MFITRLMITLLAFSLVGCAPIKYLQPNSDTLPTNLLPSKATVLVEVSFGSANAPVLFLTKKITADSTYEKVTAVDIVEFANYEGAVIPSYSSKAPYGVHAFHITPGQYVIMRCVYGAPEIEWCIPGAWKNNGSYVGLATFEVKAGEVVNVGNLNVTRDRKVSIQNNNTEALKYLKKNRPELAPMLKYRPMTFTPI